MESTPDSLLENTDGGLDFSNMLLCSNQIFLDREPGSDFINHRFELPVATDLGDLGVVVHVEPEHIRQQAHLRVLGAIGQGLCNAEGQLPCYGCQKGDTIDEHGVDAQLKVPVLQHDGCWHISGIVDGQQRLATPRLPLDEAHIRTPDLFSSLHISNGDWVLCNALASNHGLQVSNRRESHGVKEPSSSNGCVLVFLGVLGKVLLDSLHHTILMGLEASRYTGKQALLGLSKTDGTHTGMDNERQLFGGVKGDSILLADLGETEHIGDPRSNPHSILEIRKGLHHSCLIRSSYASIRRHVKRSS